FSVAVNGDDWYQDDDGMVVREIHRISRLYDVSPVTYPAYLAANSTVRSMEAWKEARDSGGIAKAVNEKLARERLLTLMNV
ncbi:HK97 family phage prohead protease, partial [Morganella morganii]|nr:HK97 family phage prohead protease [Morganella morganii]